MVPGSNIDVPTVQAIRWRGAMPPYAALIPRKAMGSWMEEWEDGEEPEGWVARRMADAFARMEKAAQPVANFDPSVTANAEKARRRETSIAWRTPSLTPALRIRPDVSESRIASLVALVATRPVHGPPLLPA